MSDMPTPAGALAVDSHEEGRELHVTVVSPTRLAIAKYKPALRERIEAALRSEGDTIAALCANSPHAQGPTLIALADIESLEWFSDEEWLTIHHYDPDKFESRETLARTSGVDARARVIEAMREVLGEFEYHERAASAWHTGSKQIIGIGLTVLLFFGGGLAKHFEGDHEGRVQVRRGWKMLFAKFANAVGEIGLYAIGCGLIVALLLWWRLACKNPPVRSVAFPPKKKR